MIGYIHSSESFGTVDGPGIRYVIFMQGCTLRCKYCHNPDTWKIKGGQPITAQSVIDNFNKNRAFYSNGGITASGGEPLLQIDFLTELFSMAKREGIHTCIDTSGVTYNPANADEISKLDALMQYTDLVMLDIKHIDNAKHIELTGRENTNILGFAKYLESKKIPLWVRHVVVPGYTDNHRDLQALGRFIGTLTNLKALDVLPYHTLGVEKYKMLNIPYALEGVPALCKSDAVKAKAHIFDGIRQARELNIR